MAARICRKKHKETYRGSPNVEAANWKSKLAWFRNSGSYSIGRRIQKGVSTIIKLSFQNHDLLDFLSFSWTVEQLERLLLPAPKIEKTLLFRYQHIVGLGILPL